jgi:hypothetical protein
MILLREIKMAFHELTAAWQKLMQSSTYVADHVSQTVIVSVEVFDAFHKEFNLCFIEPDEDAEFQSWREGI